MERNVSVAVLDVRILPEKLKNRGNESLIHLDRISSEASTLVIKPSNFLERPQILEESEGKLGAETVDEATARKFLLECKNSKDVQGAFSFFGRLPTPTLSLFRLLLGVCITARDYDGARKAFQASKISGFTSDCGLYTAFITACCKTNQLEAAFMAFHDMESSGIEPSVMTYGVLIDGCVKSKQVAKAFGVYGIMISKKVKADKVIYHSLMMACGKGENIDRAFDVLQDMKSAGITPDHVTMTILLDVCTKCKRVDRSLGVYRTLRKKGAATTVAAFTSAVNACSVTGSLPDARQIYRDMQKDGVKPDDVFFCALIKVAAQAEEPKYAFFLRQEMKAYNVQLSTQIYNAWLNLCCELKLTEKGLSLFEEMKEQRISPDIVTFNAVLQILCTAERLEEALAMKDRMSKYGVKPNHLTYMVLIKGCTNLRVRNAEMAFKLYHAADLDGRCANLENCNSMIDICYHQIRNHMPAPTFSITAGRFSLDATMRSPSQQWAMCAVSIYQQFVLSGSIPTRPLVSKLLGCLRKRRELGLGQSGVDMSAEVSLPLFMDPVGGSLQMGFIQPPESSDRGHAFDETHFFESQAFTIYEEASNMGVLPVISEKAAIPEKLSLEGLQPNAAEVCILSYLRCLKSSRKNRALSGKQSKIPALEIALDFKECSGGDRAVQLAGRTGEAVTAVLRRLKIPFTGTASSGKLLITSKAISGWLRKQPACTANGSLPAHPSFGQNISSQQRAIRMGSAPSYSPAAYYKKPSLVSDYKWEGLE